MPALAAPAPDDPDEVVLLKFPYPYRSALTIASDTHMPSVETFTAVHILLNSTSLIPKGSRAWQLLFSDPAIEKREAWRTGISGFGLPTADSFWFYHPVTGVYTSFDDAAEVPLPHFKDGIDFRDIVDSWIRRGWVDTLHTAGEGNISRSALKAGFAWMASDPHRRLRVWSNHTYTETPTCMGPAELRALPLVLKNMAKIVTTGMCLLGGERLARRIAANPYPSPFPEGQQLKGYLLAALLVACLLWLLYCLARPGARRPINFAFGVLALGICLAALHVMELDYCQGDNPESPYYCADLVRQAGFRYYWLLPGASGYQPEIPGTLRAPQWSYGARQAGLSLVRLDDGTQVFAYSRCYKGDRGLRTLDLLTDAALSDLCEQEEMSILYTHWTDSPKEVFDATGLDGLARLRRYREQGRVWVAPTSVLLQFTFVRTFLEYSSRLENGLRVIDIGRVSDPTDAPFMPSLSDLRGLSFDCPAGPPITVQVAGQRVDPSEYDTIAAGGRTIVRFSMTPDEVPSTTMTDDVTPILRRLMR
jgi:hypothetical protein